MIEMRFKKNPSILEGFFHIGLLCFVLHIPRIHWTAFRIYPVRSKEM